MEIHDVCSVMDPQQVRVTEFGIEQTEVFHSVCRTSGKSTQASQK